MREREREREREGRRRKREGKGLSTQKHEIMAHSGKDDVVKKGL